MKEQTPAQASRPARALRFYVYIGNLGHWLRFLWPILLVVGGGWLFFAQAVVDTIKSTPHPALVYAIFGSCAVAVVSAAHALYLYLREMNLARDLLTTEPHQRMERWVNHKGHSPFAPVYDLVLGQTRLAMGARQSAVATEMEAAELALEARLEFSNFLGGALVGLGLVGTFVGLLGTLDDLSLVFGALVNSGSSDVSPTAMFADMVAKLQAPMRGMGTAFVASLYGLLGSLVITLMLVAARKTNAAMNHCVHSVVRRLGYGLQAEDLQADGQSDTSIIHADLQAMRKEVATLGMLLREQNLRHAEQSQALSESLGGMLSSMQDSAKAHGQHMTWMLEERKTLAQQLADVLQQSLQQQVAVQGHTAAALRDLNETTAQVVQGQYAAERTMGSCLGELNAVVRQLQQRQEFAFKHDGESLRQLLEQLRLCQQALTHNASVLSVTAQHLAGQHDAAPQPT